LGSAASVLCRLDADEAHADNTQLIQEALNNIKHLKNVTKFSEQAARSTASGVVTTFIDDIMFSMESAT